MLIREITAYIQTILNKGPRSDDSLLSDRAIYFMVKSIRAKLLKQRFDKYNTINEFNYQYIDCVQLERKTLYDCPCMTQECKFMVSKQIIPRYMTTRNDHLIKVFTIDGNEIPFITSKKDINNFKHTLTKANKLVAFLHKERLTITGAEPTMIKTVTLKILAEDPLEIANFPSCDGTTPCFDPYYQDFPMDTDLIETLTKMSYDEFARVMMSVPNDLSNDANGVINQN